MTNIVTLELDPDAQAHFERLRQEHYPAELNQIAAHLTLFHTLPDTPAVKEALVAAAARPAFRLKVTGLRPLGRGVAFTLASQDLQDLHAELSESFRDDLSPQDKQRFMPHVVVQNKATPERARLLLAALRASFKSFEAQAHGLALWNYLGGPWRLAGRVPFTTTT